MRRGAGSPSDVRREERASGAPADLPPAADRVAAPGRPTATPPVPRLRFPSAFHTPPDTSGSYVQEGAGGHGVPSTVTSLRPGGRTGSARGGGFSVGGLCTLRGGELRAVPGGSVAHAPPGVGVVPRGGLRCATGALVPDPQRLEHGREGRGGRAWAHAPCRHPGGSRAASRPLRRTPRGRGWVVSRTLRGDGEWREQDTVLTPALTRRAASSSRTPHPDGGSSSWSLAWAASPPRPQPVPRQDLSPALAPSSLFPILKMG